jgi:hypothetical protein
MTTCDRNISPASRIVELPDLYAMRKNRCLRDATSGSQGRAP